MSQLKRATGEHLLLQVWVSKGVQDMSDISTKKVMMAMATMALLPWKCPIYRGRKSTLQVPNMHRGHMFGNVTLLGGEEKE